jgi:hypothetical protein
LAFIDPAIKHDKPDVGARRAVPRLGEARLAPTIDMFNCPRNTVKKGIVSIKKPEEKIVLTFS